MGLKNFQEVYAPFNHSHMVLGSRHVAHGLHSTKPARSSVDGLGALPQHDIGAIQI
jgi:hypothetical protein